MKTIVSFGDSFIYGSELQNNIDGSNAWPGLIAKDLGCNYKTLAVPGCGNEAIARQVFTYFSSNSTQDTLAVINWTWIMRWDFYLSAVNEWIALGPTCVPDKLKNLLSNSDSQALIAFYRTHISESHAWNQLRSLQAVLAIQSFLKINNIRNIQTYMDRDLFMPGLKGSKIEHYNAYKDPSWPDIILESELDNLPSHIKEEVAQAYQTNSDPTHIQMLQQLTQKEIQDFEGLTFLEWSRKNGYEVTVAPGDHPLEQAHYEAAQLWTPKYQQQLQ
jgi:hypothetical protein